MSHDMDGRPASEEEVAEHLGFSGVAELRRWQTDLGHKVVELEHALRQARDEAAGFRWHGLRMDRVLAKVLAWLGDQESISVGDLILAIGVVRGGAVDWDHRLDGWFGDITGGDS